MTNQYSTSIRERELSIRWKANVPQLERALSNAGKAPKRRATKYKTATTRATLERWPRCREAKKGLLRTRNRNRQGLILLRESQKGSISILMLPT